ncbi:hypothetical protein A1D23_10355 [Chelonobacter oris]|nr:hypothetical protein [Chelonobacter oris]
MRIFIVNLKLSLDRKDYMIKLCNLFGLNVEFVEAVYGKELQKSFVDSIYDSLKSYHTIGREMTLGEIGCALSHIRIYKYILEHNIDVALILEDDVFFEKDLLNALEQINLYPEDWNLVLLGHYSTHINGREIESPVSYRRRFKLNTGSLYKLMGYGYGTHGYLINQIGAKKLVNATRIIYKPIDHYTSDNSILNIYALLPTVIKVNNNFDTTINDRRIIAKSIFKNNKLIYKLRNFILRWKV